MVRPTKMLLLAGLVLPVMWGCKSTNSQSAVQTSGPSSDATSGAGSVLSAKFESGMIQVLHCEGEAKCQVLDSADEAGAREKIKQYYSEVMKTDANVPQFMSQKEFDDAVTQLLNYVKNPTSGFSKKDFNDTKVSELGGVLLSYIARANNIELKGPTAKLSKGSTGFNLQEGHVLIPFNVQAPPGLARTSVFSNLNPTQSYDCLRVEFPGCPQLQATAIYVNGSNIRLGGVDLRRGEFCARREQHSQGLTRFEVDVQNSSTGWALCTVNIHLVSNGGGNGGGGNVGGCRRYDGDAWACDRVNGCAFNRGNRRCEDFGGNDNGGGNGGGGNGGGDNGGWTDQGTLPACGERSFCPEYATAEPHECEAYVRGGRYTVRDQYNFCYAGAELRDQVCGNRDDSTRYRLRCRVQGGNNWDPNGPRPQGFF